MSAQQQALGVFVRLPEGGDRKPDTANLKSPSDVSDKSALPIDRRRDAVGRIQVQFPTFCEVLRSAEHTFDALHGRHVYVRMKQRHACSPQVALDVLGFHLMNSYATYEALHTIHRNNLKLFQFKPAVTRQRLVAASAVTGGVSYARPPEPETPTYFHVYPEGGLVLLARHPAPFRNALGSGRVVVGVQPAARTHFPSAPVAGPVSGEGHIVFPKVSAPCGEEGTGRYDPVSSEAKTGNVRIRPHRNFSSRGVSRPTDLLPGRSVASAAQLAGAVTATPAVPASFFAGAV